MRVTAVRHSPTGFGLLVSQSLDAEETRAWVEPCLSDPAIRQDVARFAQKVDPEDLNAASNRLRDFDGPALLVWGASDRFFKLDYAHRLRDAFTDARLVEIEKGRTFIPPGLQGLRSRRCRPVAPGQRPAGSTASLLCEKR
jgi:pimeloyl-ACP methyl ester carboxylesterase